MLGDCTEGICIWIYFYLWYRSALNFVATYCLCIPPGYSAKVITLFLLPCLIMPTYYLKMTNFTKSIESSFWVGSGDKTTSCLSH